MAEPRRVDACSLPLQATLYLHARYVPLFLAMEVGCLAFKGKPHISLVVWCIPEVVALVGILSLVSALQ